MIKQEWLGYINNQPCIVYLVVLELTDGSWMWEAEIRWEEQYAIKNKLNSAVLWEFVGAKCFNRIDALRFGREWLMNQGFHYNKDVQ